jgi:hypothetical protein
LAEKNYNWEKKAVHRKPDMILEVIITLIYRAASMASRFNQA